MPYPAGAGSNSGTRYKVGGIPQAFLIDHEGRILWEGHHAGGPAFDRALQSALEEAKNAGGAWDPGERPEAVKSAAQLAKDGKLGAAWKETDSLLKKYAENAEATEAVSAFRADFTAAAAARTERAKKQAEAGRVFQATRYLETQIKAYKGAPPEQEWSTLLKDWKADPEAKKLYQIGEGMEKAWAMVAEDKKDQALKQLERLLADAKGTTLEQEVRDAKDTVRMM